MTDERCLQVPYYVVGAAASWTLGIVLMGAATVTGEWVLACWALVVVGAAMVWTIAYLVRAARMQMLDAIALQLRIDQAARGGADLPRVPTLR